MSLRFSISNKDIKLKEMLDKDFLELEMYVISDDKPNRNFSHFTKKAMYNSIDTFYNKPVLGFFNLKKGDFEEHNSDIEYDEDTEDLYWSYEAVDAEVPLGLIRESDTVDIVEKGGKTWIKLTCAIWVKYNREKVKKLLKDRKKKVSVEVQVTESHYEEVEGKGEIMFIDNFVFDGVTILGAHRGSNTEPVMEGIEGAHLSIPELVNSELFAKRKNVLSFAYQKLEDNKSDKDSTNFGTNFYINNNFEEKEGRETLVNFTNIAEGYTLLEVQDECAIFKKDEKLYSFSLKDVDCTQDVEFSEENLAEVVEATVEPEIEVSAEEVAEENVTEVEVTEEAVEENFAVEDEEKEAEDDTDDENEPEDKDDDEDDKDDDKEVESCEDKKEEIKEEEACKNTEEEFTADEPATEEPVVEEPETEMVEEPKEEEVVAEEKAPEADFSEYEEKIKELEEENKVLKEKLFTFECEKMVEYAKQLMAVRDLTDEEKEEIIDNCTKGMYADNASLEKEIGYILFKKGAGVVDTTKQKNFSVSIINDNKDVEKEANVFARLKKTK